MATPVSDKGKKPMEADSSGFPSKNTRKGQQNPIFGCDSEGTPVPSDSSAKIAQKDLEKQLRKAKIDVKMLREIQADVQANISTLNNTSLFATVIGNPIEAKEIRRKIKIDWKFLSAGFQLFPLANSWFELRFDLKEDRDKVWGERPFHVLGQLLLFRRWRQDFCPYTESVAKLDMWVRFPGLPTKYVSDSLLKAIVERNKLGEVIRVAAFNPNGARLRYPRVCIIADLSKIPNKRVLVPNGKGELETYPVWFEDFPVGCGSCGDEEHSFENCPGRRVCSKNGGGIMGSGPEDSPMKDNSREQSNDGSEWVEVTRKQRSLPPPSFGHSKEELWKSFGRNVELLSDSSSEETSNGTGDLSTTSFTESIRVETLPLVPEMEEYVVVDDYHEQDEEAPGAEYPNDANPRAIEADFQDPEFYEADDDDMIEAEEDYDGAITSGGIPADFTQADFDRMLGNIPASTEFLLPNLYNPDCLPSAALNPLVAPSASPSGLRSEQQGIEGVTKSESGKRKHGVEEGESASSKLMGGGNKRGKNGE